MANKVIFKKLERFSICIFMKIIDCQKSSLQFEPLANQNYHIFVFHYTGE